MEIEAKVKVDSFREVRRLLADAGATRLGRHWEKNVFFDRPSRELKDRGHRLRLRMKVDLEGEDHEPILTFKGRRLAGPLKRREEIEVTVADSSDMIRLLEAMGYHRIFLYEKRRERWSLNGCRIELDDLPLLGSFVEAEGDDEVTVLDTLRLLALDRRKKIRKGYASLLRKHLRKHGRDTSQATFGSDGFRYDGRTVTSPDVAAPAAACG